MASEEAVASAPATQQAAGTDGQLSFAEAPVAKEVAQPLRPDPAAVLYEWEFRMPEPPQRSALWMALTLVAALVLAAQILYAFRTEMTILVPQARSYYEHFCEAVGCHVGLPMVSNFLHIETSDLKAVDPAHPSEIQLLLSVRNRAPVELAYPAFELTLTDSLDQALLRRVFLPSEYLSLAARSGGLKPGTELPIQLYLDTGSVRAAGYRLYLFYP